MKPRSRLILMAASAGAATALCWLPFGLAPLLPVALFFALRAFRRVRSPRDAVVFGLTYAAARYAVASHFLLALVAYSPLAIVFYLLAIAFILPYGLLEGWGAFTLERRGGLPRSVGFGLLFTIGEWLRSLGDLSFPADLLSHAFGSSPAWLALSSVTGPFGLTMLAFAAAALADLAIEHRVKAARLVGFGSAAVVLWGLPPAIDSTLATGDGEPAAVLRVAVVQPVVDVADKLRRDRWPMLRDRLTTLTIEAAKGSDLVVWPESARPGPLVWKESEAFHDTEMQELATRVGVPILYGCEIARLSDGAVRALYNGAALVRPDGAAEWYGKERLLPFVEGVPFAHAFGYDPARRARETGGRRSLLTLLGNFVPGPAPTVFHVGPARIGVLICYEGMYSALGRAYREAGANALVVLTNDSWWGRSVFPAWHAHMVAERSRELDVPVLRAANSGISSLTDRFGRTHESTALGTAAILRTILIPGPAIPTPYTKLGDVPIGLAFLVVGSTLARGVATTRSAPADPRTRENGHRRSR